MFVYSAINLLTIPFRFAGLVTPFPFIQFIEISSSHESSLRFDLAAFGRIWQASVQKKNLPFDEPCRWTLLHILWWTLPILVAFCLRLSRNVFSYYFIFGKKGFLQVSSIHLLNSQTPRPHTFWYLCIPIYRPKRHGHAGLMFSFRAACHRSPMFDTWPPLECGSSPRF